MQIAEYIIQAYQSRAASNNWATWAKSHPEQNELLMTAQRIYNDG